ncbi:MAG: hypothetical protein NZM33_16690, partial [Bryobacteraceae bacterium]|nr:hypothetical protein [Bryobacteraceae bacterium]
MGVGKNAIFDTRLSLQNSALASAFSRKSASPPASGSSSRCRARGNTWIWDPRPGTYSIEWWEGPQRRREAAGTTPAEALHALKRKQWELAGQALLGLAAPESDAVGTAVDFEASPFSNLGRTPAAGLRNGLRSTPAAPPLSAVGSGRAGRVLMGTPLRDAVAEYLEHIRVHSPEKPQTLQRYRSVMQHFLRLLG